MDKPPRTIYREVVKELFEGQCEANCRIFLVCTLHASTSNLLCVISETTKQKFGDSIGGLSLQLSFWHIWDIYTRLMLTLAPIVPVKCTWNTHGVSHTYTHGVTYRCALLKRRHIFFFIFSPPKIVFTRTYMTHVCYRANLLLFTFFFCPIFTVWSWWVFLSLACIPLTLVWLLFCVTGQLCNNGIFFSLFREKTPDIFKTEKELGMLAICNQMWSFLLLSNAEEGLA